MILRSSEQFLRMQPWGGGEGERELYKNFLPTQFKKGPNRLDRISFVIGKSFQSSYSWPYS
jgi:hypothetical protein